MGIELLGGRVTARAQPMFWAVAALIGWSFGDGTAAGFLLATVAVAVSVAFHEAGHAAACVAFGSGAEVTLGGLGGWTVPRDPARIQGWRLIALDLAGCAAGLTLAAGSFAAFLAAAAFRVPLPGLAVEALGTLIAVNVAFTLFNLLPIAPMDGARFVEHVLKPRFGLAGLRGAHALGLLVGGGAALWFLARGNAYTALLCLMMVGVEARALKRSFLMSPADEDAELQADFRKAVEAWERGERDAGADVLSAVRSRAEKGLLYAAATLQLACWLHVLGRDAEALELFRASAESDMPPAARSAYCATARARGDHESALRLARTLFHDAPGPESAATAAVCAAASGDAAQAVHWLRTAVRLGLPAAAARSSEFARVAGAPEFREYLAETGAGP